jgi:hypothetical protein
MRLEAQSPSGRGSSSSHERDPFASEAVAHSGAQGERKIPSGAVSAWFHPAEPFLQPAASASRFPWFHSRCSPGEKLSVFASLWPSLSGFWRCEEEWVVKKKGGERPPRGSSSRSSREWEERRNTHPFATWIGKKKHPFATWIRKSIFTSKQAD